MRLSPLGRLSRVIALSKNQIQDLLDKMETKTDQSISINNSID